MFVKTIIVFIAASTFLYPQGINDTTFIVGDTLLTTDTTVVSDSLFIVDSVVHYDTVIYFPRSFYQNSFKIERKIFLRNDYRYTGDLIEPFQFNFIRNLGTPGQANETFIYGVGFDGISFLQDGILLNDRRLNFLDLNLVQSEDIETIEILPSPRGFLYSPVNNPVTVNFITRDFIPAQPYSRIKYYQGPYGEAMVDGSFNALISRNFQFSFDVTNRKYDSSYTNTGFSTWMAKVRARYYFANNMYLSATYNYADKQTGNWQGVDADSILRSGISLDDLLFEPDFAPVINSFRKRNDLLHKTSLRFTSVQSENSRTELTLYHLFRESRFDLSEFDNTTTGLNLYQNFEFSPFKLHASLTYEENNFENWYRGNTIIPAFYGKWNQNFFALSGSISLDFLEDITPTVFGKFNGISKGYNDSDTHDESLIGYGTDISYKLTGSLRLYIGYSEFEIAKHVDKKTNNFEVGITYITENYSADLKYFARNNTNIILETPLEFLDNYRYFDLRGIGLSSDVKFWVFQFESSLSAYFPVEQNLYQIPEFNLRSGLYFRGFLFEENLNLKSGLRFSYLGELNAFTGEYPSYNVSNQLVEPSYKLDFIVSGEIRKAAIIYFTIENLLDRKYFVTPYYPMPGISLRFGLAWEFLN